MFGNEDNPKEEEVSETETESVESKESDSFVAEDCCNGCPNPQPCRNQLSRPENVKKCAAMHGLIVG